MKCSGTPDLVLSPCAAAPVSSISDMPVLPGGICSGGLLCGPYKFCSPSYQCNLRDAFRLCQYSQPGTVSSIVMRGSPLCQAAACHSPLVPFGETPETITQLVFDQSLHAFRSQRPAYAPLLKQPSASHSLWPEVPASV